MTTLSKDKRPVTRYLQFISQTADILIQKKVLKTNKVNAKSTPERNRPTDGEPVYERKQKRYAKTDSSLAYAKEKDVVFKHYADIPFLTSQNATDQMQAKPWSGKSWGDGYTYWEKYKLELVEGKLQLHRLLTGIPALGPQSTDGLSHTQVGLWTMALCV